jgi:hypothetical protein
MKRWLKVWVILVLSYFVGHTGSIYFSTGRWDLGVETWIFTATIPSLQGLIVYWLLD